LKHTVYLGLGTNLGDRLKNLQDARSALEPQVHVVKVSPIYETAPWGYLEQPSFLNQALRAETELSPEALLDFLKHLEQELGRTPTFRNGPRLIDIDILFYDHLILTTNKLRIPHPSIEFRTFVLAPLADIAPYFCHPVLGCRIQDLLSQVDASDVKVYAEID
jgi:2-amino-4-hydroxy-6-hydroxymethyldihydropteridine diphosphokinase